MKNFRWKHYYEIEGYFGKNDSIFPAVVSAATFFYSKIAWYELI